MRFKVVNNKSIQEGYSPNELDINSSVYDKLNRKRICDLTFDEITYLYAFENVWSKFYGEDEEEFETDVDYTISKLKSNSTDRKYLEDCLKFCKSIKLPMKIYRALNKNEISSDGHISLKGTSWTIDSTIYTDKRSKFYNNPNVVSAILDDYSAIHNSWTIQLFMQWSLEKTDSSYPEYEIALTPSKINLNSIERFN